MFPRPLRHPAAEAGAVRESADFSVILNEFLDAPVYAKFIGYRLARLGGKPVLQDIPTDATQAAGRYIRFFASREKT